MAESEFCTHKPPAPKNSYPRIHKAQLRSGWRVSLPLPPPAGDSQWPSSGMSPLSVVVKQYSVCDDLQSLPAHVHLWFRELVRVSFFLSGERLRSSTVAFSLPSGSAGADADVPYLCSGIMHTPRCASKTPFRTTSWWRVWSADDFLPFFIQDPSQFLLRAPSRHWLSKFPIISAQGRSGLMGQLGLGAPHWAAEAVSVLT